MREAVRAFVALGSNLGDRTAMLVLARDAIAASTATRISAASRIYETEPVGPPGQGRYLNAVLELETRLTARSLLERLLAIEQQAGRDRRDEPLRCGPRVLDLDLLLYGDVCIEEAGLEVPHPRLHERAFVLAPLCELAPELVHPRHGGSLAHHLGRCAGRGDIRLHDAPRGWASGVPGGHPEAVREKSDPEAVEIATTSRLL